MVTLEACSIGDFQDSLCHKTFYTHGKTGLIRVSELSKEDVELLIWRTGIYKKIFVSITILNIWKILQC